LFPIIVEVIIYSFFLITIVEAKTDQLNQKSKQTLLLFNEHSYKLGMASSKVVAVVVSTNPDLPRAPSISSSSFLFSSHFHLLPSKNTTNMDEILKNIYPAAIEAASAKQQQSTTDNNIDDVWKDIVAGGGTNHHDHQYQYQHQYHPSSEEGFSTYSPGGDEVTLEDFLVRAGAVPATAPFSPHQYPSSSDASHSLPFATVKRKAVEEKPELDKATLQKQKRMIKNRESAARSRERKQVGS
jgi:ABA responsive element binding factor